MDESYMRPRGDFPRAFHHVTNRGVAQRSLFENEADVRYFLSRCAKEARDGFIRVHAFVLMPNHFHMLVQSMSGELSDAMMRIEYGYARWFNKRRNRDGPLFKGRFHSCLIDSNEYWCNVVSYIDMNPVSGGLVDVPFDYHYGSARIYITDARPTWFHRDEVECTVMAAARLEHFTADGYRRVFHAGVTKQQLWHVERRITKGPAFSAAKDPLRELIGAAPDAIRVWLLARAEVADGAAKCMPVADPESLLLAVRRLRAARPRTRCRLHHSNVQPWHRMTAGLLRELSGLTGVEIASWTKRNRSTIQSDLREHAQLLLGDESYAALCAEVTHGIVRQIGVRKVAGPFAEVTSE